MVAYNSGMHQLDAVHASVERVDRVISPVLARFINTQSTRRYFDEGFWLPPTVKDFWKGVLQLKLENYTNRQERVVVTT